VPAQGLGNGHGAALGGSFFMVVSSALGVAVPLSVRTGSRRPSRRTRILSAWCALSRWSWRWVT